MSDPLRITAQGLPTLLRQGKKYDANAILDIVLKNGVTGIIYGIPKNMDGILGCQAEKPKFS